MIDRIICRLFGHLWVAIKCYECGTGIEQHNFVRCCNWCRCGKMFRHGHVFGCPAHSSGVYECSRCGRLEWLQ